MHQYAKTLRKLSPRPLKETTQLIVLNTACKALRRLIAAKLIKGVALQITVTTTKNLFELTQYHLLNPFQYNGVEFFVALKVAEIPIQID